MITPEIGAIVSAPNQNHENFAQRTERLIPFFGANILSRLVTLHSGKPLPAIDMWNNFGHQMDEAYSNQSLLDGASRRQYADLLIDKKYAYFASLGINIDTRTIVRDDDPETMSWMEQRLQKLYDEGIIYEDTEALSVCTSCGNIISVATVKVGSCSRCKSQDIAIEKRPSLFVDLPGSRQQYVHDKILLPKNAGHINGQFATLPGRVIVSRQRDYGQPLDFLGYEGMVLDPKIGLGLMPEMIVERFKLKVLTQVQGAPTAKNTVPYTTLLSPDIETRYIFTNHVPGNISTTEVQKLGVDFFTKYLPLFMLDKTGDVNDAQLNSLVIEYSKAKRKLDNALHYLRTNIGEDIPMPAQDKALLSDSLSNFANQNIRSTVINLRKYIFEGIGKRYTDELRLSGKSIADDDLTAAEKILKEIF